MAEDLERGPPPEIDWLNGEIAVLGRAHGIRTPANDRLIDLVKEAFADPGRGPWTGDALLAETEITS